jgi:hypothetical protein
VATYTLQQLANKIRRRLGVFGSSFVADSSDGVDEINDSIATMDEELVRIAGIYQSLAFEAFATTPGTREYAFGTVTPSLALPVLRWLGVGLLQDNVLLPLSPLGENDIILQDARSWTSTRPRYKITALGIGFSHPPDAAETVVVKAVPSRGRLALVDPVEVYWEQQYEWVTLDVMENPPTSSRTTPRAIAPTPAHTGTLTRSFAFTDSCTGQSFTSRCSFV